MKLKTVPTIQTPRSQTSDSLFENLRVTVDTNRVLEKIRLDAHTDLKAITNHTALTSINGFVDKSDSTISFTDATRTFSIQPSGSEFYYYVAGDKYKSTGDTIIITDVEGVHVIYYDASGIAELVNPTLSQFDAAIRTECLISIIYWNATDNEGIYVGEERHGVVMDSNTHSYLHFSQGLAYISGLALGDMSVDGTGATADAQFSVSAGSVSDEDLYIAISAIGATTGLPIYYMLGASARWVRTVQSGFSMRTSGGTDATRLAWNEYTGGAWQLTEVANNQFVLCHVFATTEKDKPMVAIIGQNDYNTKTAARAGAQTEINSLVLDDTLFPEIKAVATVIFQTSLTYASAINAKIVSTDDGDDYIDWRETSISSGGVSFASPLTTKGDIYTYGTGDTRLPAATLSGYPLVTNTATSTGLKWGTNTLNLGNLSSADDTYINILSSGNSLAAQWDQSNKYILLNRSLRFEFTDSILQPALGFFPTYTNFAPIEGVFNMQPSLTGLSAFLPESTAIGGQYFVKFVPTNAVQVFGMKFSVDSSTTNGSATYLKTVGAQIITLGGVGANTLESIGLSILPFYGISPTAVYTSTDVIGISLSDGVAAGTVNITNQYQLKIAKPTQATNNFQVYLLGNGDGTGIWFDGAERLYSDGTSLISVAPFQAAFESSDGSSGVTTTFTNGDGATVTVKDGIITGIA